VTFDLGTAEGLAVADAVVEPAAVADGAEQEDDEHPDTIAATTEREARTILFMQQVFAEDENQSIVKRQKIFGSDCSRCNQHPFLLEFPFDIFHLTEETATKPMMEKIKMRDGDTMLIMVKDGAVIHFTPNMSLPHAEFVKRTTGKLPEGAWVGTASKLDGRVVAITSKYFFDYQLPGPDWVQAAVCENFE
jgi:hypothetical protein